MDFESDLAGDLDGLAILAGDVDFFFGDACSFAFDLLRLSLGGSGAAAGFFSGLGAGLATANFLGEGARI